MLTTSQVLINSKRGKRAQQTVLLIAPVVLAIVGIVAVLFYGNKVITQLNIIVAKFQKLIDLSSVLSIFKTICNAVMFNLDIYLAYIIVRIVLLGVNKALSSKNILFKNWAEIFYEYDDEYKKWFIKERWINTRQICKVLCWVGAVGVGIVLGIMWYLARSRQIFLMIFPIMVHMVVTEFFVFINGYTKEEFANSVGGDDSYAMSISNFYKIREIYEKIFPREVLVSHTGCEYSSTAGTVDLLDELSKGEKEDAVVSHFFSLNETEDRFDTDCILATRDLMKGENVVFFNPFYRDLGKYIVLPLMSTLLKGRKCLVIVGRNSAKEDMKDWLREILTETSKIKSMWRVDDLSFKSPDCEVGFLGFSQIYDESILEANKEFFKQVKFVIVLEASLMLNTGQVGLSILANQMVKFSDKPTYCIMDRMVEGLVDTMSHVIRDEITKVVAPPVSHNLYTGMAWNADGDYLRQKLFGKQTKFLGNGIELAAVAIKNQVKEVSWFAERKAPVKDIQWISGQFYPYLCQYMNLPIQQQSVYDKIKFISNVWSVPERSEQFLIAEDEFVNMFSTMRTFLSRGKDHTFVNILSENYLLRDYMRCNPKLFMANPNAIPSLVPDYAKTERNTLIKLLLLMSYDYVSESQIRDEFMLLGINTKDVFYVLNSLLEKYTKADSSIFTVKTITYDSDGINLKDENLYSILPEKFEEFFGDDLRNAYYVCEEEKTEAEYIEAKLFGHVTQTILPGQMVTYDGKYYIAKYVSPESGVVLRRASNLYDGRVYYRQIRKYIFDSPVDKDIISSNTVMDIEITKSRTDFSVTTSGYLKMNDNGNLRSARVVDFSKDPLVNEYNRQYLNKSVLRIKLPETNDRIRFTFCMLLSEILRSVFPEGWPYIAVMCTRPDDIDGMLNYMMYELEGNVEDDYIYIVEDSNLDLGLLEAIEKNFMQFMDIITDYLFWHFDKMREVPMKDPEIHTVEFPEVDLKKRKKFTELAKRVKKLFGGKKEDSVAFEDIDTIENKKRTEEAEIAGVNAEVSKDDVALSKEFEGLELEVPKKPEDSSENASDDMVVYAEEATEENNLEVNADSDESVELTKSVGDDVSEPEVMFTPEKASEISNSEVEQDEEAEDYNAPVDVVAVDGTDIFDQGDSPEIDEYFEECFTEMGIIPIMKSRYQNECFLKFGFNEIDKRIRLEETKTYLTSRGFSNNSLTKARVRDGLEPGVLDIEAVNHCDFCGIPISGVSYQRLTDGRIRCNDCGATSITDVEEFKKIFGQVFEMVQNFYGIDYKAPINVKTTDAQTIAKGAGSVYTPTTEVSSRVLGYAMKKGDVFSIVVENGSPRLATIDNMVHELTHIWQYLHWDERKIEEAYPDPAKRDVVYEGMAVWSSIQYLYLIGENSYAMQMELLQSKRTDAYGIGFNMYREKYPLIKDSSLVRYSPFTIFPPL